jgi:hypothetical protein
MLFVCLQRERAESHNQCVAATWACTAIFQNVAWAPTGPVAWGVSLLPILPGFVAFQAYLKFTGNVAGDGFLGRGIL